MSTVLSVVQCNVTGCLCLCLSVCLYACLFSVVSVCGSVVLFSVVSVYGCVVVWYCYAPARRVGGINCVNNSRTKSARKTKIGRR